MKNFSVLYVMFMLFTLILRKIVNYNRMPDQSQPIRYTPELRAAIRQMEKYSAETRLLCRHKIETPEQLREFIASRNERRKDLEHERGKVYNRMKSAKTPEQKEALVEQRDTLSAEIKVIRRELFYAGDVERRSEDIRQKLIRQQEYQEKQLGLKRPQQIKNERDIER